MLSLILKKELGMIKIISAILLAIFWQGIVLAEEAGTAKEPPEIVLDAPAPKKQSSKQKAVETETVTVYESKVFPGFRKCEPEDYRNQDSDPIACQDDDAARVLSTREDDSKSEDLIVEDDTVPQGNIFKLRFERFKKKK